jgi:hypothetical protein
MPSSFIEPCLPSPADRPPSGSNWKFLWFFFCPVPEHTSLKAVAAWREQTPKDFLFAWKASKFITHWKRLSENCVAPCRQLAATIQSVLAASCWSGATC